MHLTLLCFAVHLALWEILSLLFLFHLHQFPASESQTAMLAAPWTLLSRVMIYAYAHARTHTHTYKMHIKSQCSTLNVLLHGPTERVRQRERDSRRWGRCKVINYLWVKSNKRREFRPAAGLLTGTVPIWFSVAPLSSKNNKAEIRIPDYNMSSVWCWMLKFSSPFKRHWFFPHIFSSLYLQFLLNVK